MTNELFYNVLFETHENICWSATLFDNVYSNSFSALHMPHQYFCINPLSQSGRFDAHVSSLRNILIEFDKLPIEQQLQLLDTVPKSTLVYSGGKSYHAIISLEMPCATREEYNQLVKRIQAKLPDMDTKTSNPARLSRSPGTKRLSNGNIQTLRYVGDRLARETLEDWLGPAPVKVPRAKLDQHDKKRYKIKSPRTNAYLQFGESVFDGRNNALFEVALDLSRCGYDFDAILDFIDPICTLSPKETYATIRSAIKTANND